jgi:hypothetical protein
MNSDPINPQHYKHLPAEAIDIIEAAIAKAPSNEAAFLHGQVIKYLLRCWSKKGIEDLRKAKWYLDRLVDSFDSVLAGINATTDETPVDKSSEDRPPVGWRKVEIGEDIDTGNKFWLDGVWVSYGDEHLPCGKLTGLHVTHIRKIETPIDEPKRYREPTLADLANGPIACEVGDRHERRTLIYVFEPEPGRARFATVDESNPNCVGRWIGCRIEVTQ